MIRIIHNVTVFTNCENDTILQDKAVVVKNAFIDEIVPVETAFRTYPGAERLDGRGRLLMPGLINTHMHFYSTFARGLSLPRQPENFFEILKMLWWKLDTSLDEEGIYYSALLPAIAAVKGGVTAVIDHHASPNAVDGSLDAIEDALVKVGLRGVLCYEISDRDGAEVAQKGLAENERYIKKCAGRHADNPDHPYDALVGLHASFTLEDRTLEEAVAIASATGSGCHIHVAEDPVDEEKTRRRYHSGVIERLSRAGVISKKGIAAHCIHLNENEKDLLGESGVNVVHNPRSNMNNAVGRTDVSGLLRRGMCLGLGTDGMSGKLIPDLQAAFLLHKHHLQDCNIGWDETHRMVLQNNPEILQRVSGQKAGKIAKDYRADLILLDYFPPTEMTSENFWGHFLFGIADADVLTTIINGRIVMKDNILPGIDEAEIASKAREVSKRTWQRFYN